MRRKKPSKIEKLLRSMGFTKAKEYNNPALLYHKEVGFIDLEVSYPTVRDIAKIIFNKGYQEGKEHVGNAVKSALNIN